MLFEYAGMVDHVVELGTDIGFSTTAFLAAEVERLDCYDINITHSALLLRELAAEGPTKMYLHNENSLSANIPECDLLFIDTEHTYQQVYSELTRHAPKAGRFILLHDIVSFPVIVPAIHDYLFRHPEWRIWEWSEIQNGLAVLERAENG